MKTVYTMVIASVALATGQLLAGCSTCGPAPCGVMRAKTCGVKAGVGRGAACGVGVRGAKACGAACVMPESAAPSDKVAEIDTDALKVLVNVKGAAILDARTGKWDDGERIPGAVSLAADAGEDAVKKIINSKDSLVITYCSNVQCPASHKLAMYLKGLGYNNVLEYPKGIAGWKAAGNEVEKAN